MNIGTELEKAILEEDFHRVVYSFQQACRELGYDKKRECSCKEKTTGIFYSKPGKPEEREYKTRIDCISFSNGEEGAVITIERFNEARSKLSHIFASYVEGGRVKAISGSAERGIQAYEEYYSSNMPESGIGSVSCYVFGNNWEKLLGEQKKKRVKTMKTDFECQSKGVLKPMKNWGKSMDLPSAVKSIDTIDFVRLTESFSQK